jgi:protein disulfide-isomerase A6
MVRPLQEPQARVRDGRQICDEEMNKPFCGKMGVQGFPTLKIVRPGKKPGKPTVEDYQGPRSAKGIVDAVKDKVPNIVKRVNDKNLDEWLQGNKDTAKAILFSEKGIVSATLRALAIDFAGVGCANQKVRKGGSGKVWNHRLPKLGLDSRGLRHTHQAPRQG